MTMTIAEARLEIARLYKHATEIEAKYPDGLTEEVNKEDYDEATKTWTIVDTMESKLSDQEDRVEQQRRRAENFKQFNKVAVRHRQPDDSIVTGLSAGAVKMFGRQFVEADEYKRVIESGILHNPANRVDLGVKLDGSLLDVLLHKALVYSGSGVGGALVDPQRVPGTEIPIRPTTLLDLLPSGTTTSNMIEYYEMTTSTNNAAAVAEATNTTGTTGLKPEGAIAWLLRQLPIATIAEWVPVTNQMLSDAPFVESLIESQLLGHLRMTLETQVISGNGTAPNMLGILSNTNIQTIGLGAGSGSAIDAVYHAMTQVMVTGLANPTASVWNPLDFEQVRLARENAATGTLGAYLLGPPNLTGPTTLWGRPVALSIGMPENTALVADFTQMMLFDREQAAVRTVTINDQPVRNMQTLLAELRAVFALFRPTAVCRVTGV